MFHLDFHDLPDAFTRFMFYGHGRRNNEPYMQPVAEVDLQKMLKRHGFEDITVEPFSEAEGLGAHRKDVWRLPWTVISATKSGAKSKRKTAPVKAGRRAAAPRSGGAKQARASRA
jgi:hypothetical protein